MEDAIAGTSAEV